MKRISILKPIIFQEWGYTMHITQPKCIYGFVNIEGDQIYGWQLKANGQFEMGYYSKKEWEETIKISDPNRFKKFDIDLLGKVRKRNLLKNIMKK